MSNYRNQITTSLTTFILIVLLYMPTSVSAQYEDVYEEGLVWTVGIIRMDANMEDEYLGRLSKTWVASSEAAVQQGLIKSYKMLKGQPANAEDFNLLLMMEFENLAALDPSPARDAKWKAIANSIKLSPDYDESIKRYGDIRQFFGSKLMREIHIK